MADDQYPLDGSTPRLGEIELNLLLDSTTARLLDSAIPVLNTKSAPRVGPLDVTELVADDAAGAALDAAFIGEDHPAVVSRDIAVRRTTVDALLAHAVKADVVVDDPNVCPRCVDVVSVERQLALDGRRVEDAGPGRRRGFRHSHYGNLSSG